MIDFGTLLGALAREGVRFVVVGGAAATVHGAARLTQDLDIVYDRSRANLDALARALAPLRPYLRGAPPGLPFRLDAETLRRGLNFTLTTEAGDLDLLGEITGGGTYADLRDHAMRVVAFGVGIECLDLPTLIAVKRAAGRPKDFEAIAELEAILDEEDES
ncbi:MAG: nucleotidyl transferase AbiEii/AbiGii toxin family protein [Myxococcota bacterium]|nr:nucleotidyl transferase AbiEii/AbiGii toxin family protein [Myxococcota bacterium]